MANRVWQSSDGNWNNTASWTGATVPVSGDNVIFPSNNSVSVTSNLDQSAVDLNNLVVHPGYTGSIGSSGTHLQISADKVQLEGTGDVYYTDGNQYTNRVVINSSGSVTLSGSRIARVTALRGTITLDSNLGEVELLEVLSYRGTEDAQVTIQVGCGAITEAIVAGGKTTCGGPITTLYQSFGTLTQDASATSPISTILLFGGTCIYNTDQPPGVFYNVGGTLDFSQDARPITIDEGWTYPRGITIDPVDRVTISNGGLILDRKTIGNPV